MPQVLFDDSLGLLAQTVRQTLGDDALRHGVVLRDATGRLTFIAPREATSEEERAHVAKALSEALGPYARSDEPVMFLDESGASALMADPTALPCEVGGAFCQLLDRRIVGAGWLDSPIAETTFPPRIVFASLKGGVGRTTALALAAADLARRNSNLLLVDLDLEAPGLGAFLLDDERLPEFGVLDFLVESGIGGVPEANIGDFVGVSALTTAGGGRVDVAPVLGRRSLAHPENVLPKLARALIEDVAPDGRTITVAEKMSTMIARLETRGGYDAVLIDARAGVSELAAPALLGLGATILLFGTAQRQTIEGYQVLFAALKQLAERDLRSGRDAEWRLALKAVYAKATLNDNLAQRHRDELYELFADNLYDKEGEANLKEEVAFEIDDPDAPHWPIVIPFDQKFADFDPLRVPGQFTQVFYEQTFRPFLTALDAIIAMSVRDPRPVVQAP
jgi:MinD-like ATPase involved in chromosome partitioning or flagellar assembly